MVLKIVERTAADTEGPLGKEGGVDRLVMTWGRRVDIASLSSTRWIKRLYAGSKSALSIFRLGGTFIRAIRQRSAFSSQNPYDFLVFTFLQQLDEFLLRQDIRLIF
jgi:hypothetical protein